MDLDLIKNYLRIDFDEDDNLIRLLLDGADLFLEGAITNWNELKEDKEYALKVRQLRLAVIQDMYDNRGTKTTNYQPNRIVDSLISQLELLGVRRNA